MISVLQAWVENLPLKMQAVMVLGLRGPDHDRCPEIKKITRWLRGLVFRPADPDNVTQFMRVDLPARIKEKSDVCRELEFAPMHLYTHLMHALQVVGYKYPEPAVKVHAYNLFVDMCNLLHLYPEYQSQMDERLHDKEWPGGTQPENGVEAIELVSEKGEFLER